MPAPAVIPAPRAYINAAAVKGFVVGFRDRRVVVGLRAIRPQFPPSLFVWNRSPAISLRGMSKSAYALCIKGRPPLLL